jgi:hypothetical protein
MPRSLSTVPNMISNSGRKTSFENLGDKVIYDDFDINVALVANAQ